jgi:hypothetical protein
MIKMRVPDRHLAQFVNSKGITCRPRTEEEEEAYMEALPEFVPYVDPASLLPISDDVTRLITARMEQDKCTRAVACHEQHVTVGQYLKSLKRMKEEGR